MLHMQVLLGKAKLQLDLAIARENKIKLLFDPFHVKYGYASY